MSENLSACKALAAMVRDQGQPTIDEVNFVAQAALRLGLDPDQNEQVQAVLKDGADFGGLLEDVTTQEIQQFLFRRIVEVSLVDDSINAEERQYISNAAKAFGYGEDLVVEFVTWMRDGIAWEKRGAEIFERM